MSAASAAPRNMEDANERQPLLKSWSSSTTGSLCATSVIGALVLWWCISDYWQRDLNTKLFSIATMNVSPNHAIDQQAFANSIQSFAFPLTLAFVEFAFLGIFFAILHMCLVQEKRKSSIASFADQSWAVLAVSHVCGTFWLQTLMMPTQMMSLGAFAMSRAADIPMAAAMRAKAIGAPFGKKTLETTCFTFAAACTMFYSYAQLAGCVCIWSGNGVALSGLTFWIVYFLLLALPAASCVSQEVLMLQNEVHPLTVLAVQNLLASLLFMPVLFAAHMMGWEDIAEGFKMIFGAGQILLIVLWLSVAMAATQAACVMMIQMADSFWAVALRALRVPLWGGQMLFLHYLGSALPLSIVCPHSSLWSFVMFFGVCLGLASFFRDRRYEDKSSFEVASKSTAAPSKATSSL